MSALHELPQYWLPPVAHIENDARLHPASSTPRLQPFLPSTT
ncbi:MAG: hypothetical protein R2856_05795 [Caldilineaceae bacterium]